MNLFYKEVIIVLVEIFALIAFKLTVFKIILFVLHKDYFLSLILADNFVVSAEREQMNEKQVFRITLKMILRWLKFFAAYIKVIETDLFLYLVECHSDSPRNNGFTSLLCRGYKMSDK